MLQTNFDLPMFSDCPMVWSPGNTFAVSWKLFRGQKMRLRYCMPQTLFSLAMFAHWPFRLVPLDHVCCPMGAYYMLENLIEILRVADNF